MALTRLEELLNAIAGNGNPPAYPNWALTSDEVYLYAILNGNSDVPKPLTRKQQYLYRRATGGGDIPEYPMTTEEAYWAHFAGEEVELPEPTPEPEEEFVCPTCGKTYTSETWYNKHLLTHEEVIDEQT